ncbi:MAG: type VI secretion system-associated FHA domain protein TagH [Aliishimia sp.]
MTLVLQIENYSVLEDGGPVQFAVPPQGAQIGRSPSMHWTLPDPTRHISSHHFDIAVQNGTYYLRDVSTNGTFLQGSRYRLDGLHQLANGDRFQVGSYFIIAMLGATASVAPSAPSPQVPSGFSTPPHHANKSWDDAADPWDVGGPAEPIDPLPPRPGARADDFADDFIDLPPAGAPRSPLQQPPSAAHATFAQPAPVLSPPRTTPPTSSEIQSPPRPARLPEPPTPAPVPPVAPPPAPPVAAPVPTPVAAPEPVAPIPSVPRPDVGQVSRPTPQAISADVAKAAPVAVRSDAFVRAFCDAAGLPADSYADVDGLALAKALGESTRVVASELIMLLQARASAKQFTRGGERTMRRASDNNPLKFLPDAEQAIETMYLKHRAGFLSGPEGLSEALKDIRLHQTAVFAAIQPALAALLEGLSPEDVEAQGSAGLGLGSGKRGKAWDTFVERWDSKAAPHENGMLDEFLKHFAKAYADMVSGDAT